MKNLRCINTRNINVFGLLFLYVGIIKVAGQSVITADITAITYNASNIKTLSNHCECIKYNCGCCQYMEWDEVSLNGTLCANASYLQHEYGISMTLTFNKWTIINETVSARNPPPICIGENIVDLEIEVCLHIYDIDIDIETNKFHACFEVLGRIMKLKFSKIKLGCVNTSLYEGVRCIENNIIHQLSNFKSVKAEQKMKAESTINSGAHNGITLDFILLLLSLHSFVLLYKILVTRTI